MIQVLGRYEYERSAEYLNLPVDDVYDQILNYKIAIHNYTTRRYVDINSGIRSGETHEKFTRAVTLLSEALLWLPVCEEEHVIRHSNLTPEIEAHIHEPGYIITEPGFTSTSRDPNFELHTPCKYKLVIQHIDGRYIGEYSEYPHEDEVLIPAGASFRVEAYLEEEKTVYLTQLARESIDGDTVVQGEVA
ncbi:ADP-ribosyltransferase [Vibrio campbellii]|uniref:ADP-ribosyltransferase n=1 Tax=Vibrio campbellii TaxID=680 RepID=UPI00142DB418|nr:ADP-ribosyltransferase [Vibrio campbellii]NIY86365.1 hypothetical protein [Vibrio campbellii]NVK70948.1 hypothetical protein [Vibrio campbellii]